MRKIGWVLLACLLIGAAYVQMADTQDTRWHISITNMSDKDFAGGASRVVPGDSTTFLQLHTAMMSLPRTSVVAGSVAEEHVTYVTRSRVFRFPDYTTIQLSDNSIKMFARLRYGISDLGVNRKRLQKVIASINQK